RNILIGMVMLALHSPVADGKQIRLPVPSGTYAVGRRLVRWVDATRAETMAAGQNQKREVVVWFWYPAAASPGSKPSPYIDQLEQLATALSGDEISLARSAYSHAISNAPIATTPSPFPVILFSPGSGTIPALYSTFFEELASHGYIVTAADHPYDDLAVLLSD